MRSAALVVVLLVLGGGALGVPRAQTQSTTRPQAADSSGPGARPQAQRLLVLDEDFDGSRLDRRRWSTCHWWAQRGCTIATNHELEWYLPGQVRVGRGELRLVAERRGVRGAHGNGYRYRSGMISSGPRAGSSRPKFAFRYGRAEMRARVPAGKGLWSAFWMLPADRQSKPEIDVMEILGQRPATVEMHLHYRDGKGKRRGGEWKDSALRRGWHTFAVDWRPGTLDWLIDGVVRFRVTGAAVPSRPMYLVANLAVGGDWPGAPARSTRFPSALAIDYVKVWR